MTKKLKNLNTLDLLFTIALFTPLIYILCYWAFIAISNMGVTTQSMDYETLFITPLKNISNINILNLNSINDWLFTNVIKLDNLINNNNILYYSIQSSIFFIEYYIFMYIIKIIIKLLTYVLKICDKAL